MHYFNYNYNVDALFIKNLCCGSEQSDLSLVSPICLTSNQQIELAKFHLTLCCSVSMPKPHLNNLKQP